MNCPQCINAKTDRDALESTVAKQEAIRLVLARALVECEGKLVEQDKKFKALMVLYSDALCQKALRTGPQNQDLAKALSKTSSAVSHNATKPAACPAVATCQKPKKAKKVNKKTGNKGGGKWAEYPKNIGKSKAKSKAKKMGIYERMAKGL